MSFDTIKNILQNKEIKKELLQYQIKHLRIFGSYSKGLESESSDIDLLYDIDNSLPRNGWGIFSAKSYLENTLGKSCDLVNIKYIDSLIKDEVLQSKKQLW